MADKNRMNRVDEQIKEEVSKIISQEIHDPHLTGMVSVTSVKTTPDLRYSRVFVSMIGCKSQKENLATLKKSSGYIRTLLAKRINLRMTPELVFEFDESIEYGSKIDKILKDMNINKNEQ
jgi:ribosome-binding factor A